MNSIVLELQELASDGSRTVADLLRKALPDTLKPARFDDISKRLKKELGELPALYQLRVALRFWTTPEVELLERVRAKCKAMSSPTAAPKYDLARSDLPTKRAPPRVI